MSAVLHYEPQDQPYLDFVLAWCDLAEKGRCDGAGGKEFQRVFAEWCMAGRPMPSAPFIVTRANIGPHLVPEPKRKGKPPLLDSSGG